jgi:hypothetical protein
MRSIHRVVLASAVAAALAIPATAAAQQDLRSPDARDAGMPAWAAPLQDLRSPDTRESAHPQRPQDLRSPDAVDSARGVVPSAPAVSPVTLVRSAPVGFDWGDAGIGAGGALAVILLGTGGVLIVGRRRGIDSTPLAH